MTVPETSSATATRMPSGEVTFLFSDIQGSTALLQRLGDDYGQVLSDHRAILRACFFAHRGYEVDTAGDGFFVAFEAPDDAIAAAVKGQTALSAHCWPNDDALLVRMGLHTGRPLIVDAHYVGIDVHRAARICSAAHGGQVLVSGHLRHAVMGREPRGTDFRDLGEHRLKDLERAERLFQLDVDGLNTIFPPPRSLRPPCSVPHHATPLVGRREERQLLGEALRNPETRLITVRGPGGVGKTRLATTVVHDVLDEFTYGAHFIDLSSLRDWDQVVPLIARVLGVHQTPESSPFELVRAEISDKRVLLLLDNFEHVTASAILVARLLQACPNVTVVATSRVRLGLQDEHEFSLGPLGLPQSAEVGDVYEADAIQLFVDRARSVKPGFVLTQDSALVVAQICTMLDGLPLAIELAASKLRLFSPAALLSRLGNRLNLLSGGPSDTPERHRTLRATLQWSYELLRDEEQRYFRALAVFRGGARLESIQAVVGAREDATMTLTALIDHSLATSSDDADGEPRIDMLQTMRDYAGDLLRLDASQSQGLHERHARHYLELVERALPLGIDIDTKVVHRDYENILAALTYLLGEERRSEPAAAAEALRLAGAMGHYWFLHGLSVEGIDLLGRALEVGKGAPDRVRARALLALGYLYGLKQNGREATDNLSSAMSLFRHEQDRLGEGHCLNGLGLLALNTGRYADAEQHLVGAVSLGESVGDVGGLKGFRNNLGVLYLARGDWARAKTIFAENAPRTSTGEELLAAVTAVNLGVTHLIGRQRREAAGYLHHALRLFTELDDPNGAIETMEAAVGLAVLGGHWAVAGRLAGAAAAARQGMSRFGAPVDRIHLQRWEEETRMVLGADAFAAVSGEGEAMTYRQAISYAEAEIKVALGETDEDWTRKSPSSGGAYST